MLPSWLSSLSRYVLGAGHRAPRSDIGSEPISVLLRAGERDNHGALRQRADRADPLEPAQRRVVAVARQRAATL